MNIAKIMEVENMTAFSAVIIAAAALFHTIYKSNRDEKYRFLSLKPRLSIELNTVGEIK